MGDCLAIHRWFFLAYILIGLYLDSYLRGRHFIIFPHSIVRVRRRSLHYINIGSTPYN